MRTHFRSNAIYNQAPSSIDREKGIISDIVLCQVGEAKGHDLFIDEHFIAKVVELGNESQVGIKARFGHPNICSTALGTYLGRYKNFHQVGSRAIADLHLDSTSKKSPNGNLYDYVLDLAESNPDMFGASIAFKAGKAVKKMESLNGVEVEKNYATIVGLYAADLVDDPAATNGLFAAGHTEPVEVHEDDFAFQVSVFLDEHPEIYNLLSKKPEILDEFLTNYTQFKNRKTMNITDEINKLKNWVTENFSSKKLFSPLPGEMSEGQRGLTELKTEFESQITALESKLKSQEDIEAITQSHAELTQSHAELTQGHAELTQSHAELTQSHAELTQSHAERSRSIEAFASKHNFVMQSEVDALSEAEALTNFNSILEQADSLIKSQTETINQLQSDLNKSKAFPTVPDKKADPQLNIQKKINTDDSGKVLLENIPDNAKRKLKTK